MVDMVCRSTNELESVKMVVEFDSGPCCAMSLLKDVIPSYNVSAYTVSCGIGS